MLIKMLETRRICEDGFTVRRLYAGETRDVRETAACECLNQGWAYNAEPEDDAEADSNNQKIMRGLKVYGFSPELIEFHKKIGLEPVTKQESEVSAADVLLSLPNAAMRGAPRVSTMMREMEGGL